MILQAHIKLEGSKGVKNLNATFDSNTTYSCVAENKVKELTTSVPLRAARQISIRGDNLETNCATALGFYVNEIRLSDEFFIVPDMKEEVIIGAGAMRKWRIKLDFENDKVIVDPKVDKVILINLIKKD